MHKLIEARRHRRKLLCNRPNSGERTQLQRGETIRLSAGKRIAWPRVDRLQLDAGERIKLSSGA